MPQSVLWRGREVRIARAVGPERLGGDWWNDPYVRDYWRCEDVAGGGDLLIYQSLSHDRVMRDEPAWYVHGWYD